MKRLSWFLAAATLAVSGPHCSGDDCGLSGSQCDLIDCGFDELTCQLYAPPNDAYKIFFKRTLDEGFEYAAILVIDLVGIEQPSGLLYEGTDCTDRMLLYRPGTEEQWPDYDDCKLEIHSGGRAAGQSLDAKVSFRFNNGYFASACFNCTLEAADPE
jgi:hypothetical protein